MSIDPSPAPVSEAATRPALHALAQELRVAARAIPYWDPFRHEPWERFRDRRTAAERALSARLSRLPGCAVAASEDGWTVELTLAGVTVASQERLQGACAAWAARVGAPTRGTRAAKAMARMEPIRRGDASKPWCPVPASRPLADRIRP